MSLRPTLIRPPFVNGHTSKHGAGVEIDPAVELMLLGVEFDPKGPPVWKEETVNLKPTRVGRLRRA
jgi:hypothetical protein